MSTPALISNSVNWCTWKGVALLRCCMVLLTYILHFGVLPNTNYFRCITIDVSPNCVILYLYICLALKSGVVISIGLQ